MRRRRARGRSSGQALVEFALILPVFLLTFFGAVEFSLIVASLGTYNFAVRDAARIGSVLGRTDLAVDSKILANISGHVSGIVMATPTEIDIFRAASDGMCLNASSGAASPVTVDDPTCAKGQYLLVAGTWTLSSGPWAVSDRDDALSSADYVGVRVLFNYTFLTGFVGTLGTSLSFSAVSAQRIEPQDFTAHHQRHPASLSAAARLPVASRGGDTAPALALWRPSLLVKGGSE
jgi:Flp pilus assembly protein TadG